MYDAKSEKAKRGLWAENKVRQWLALLSIEYAHPGFTHYGPDKGDIIANGVIFDVKTPMPRSAHTKNISSPIRKDVHIDYLIGVDVHGNILGAFPYSNLRAYNRDYALVPYSAFSLDLLFEVLDLHIGDYQND